MQNMLGAFNNQVDGLGIYDEYKKAKTNSLAALAFKDPSQRQGALAQMAGINAPAAMGMQEKLGEQDKDMLAETTRAMLMHRNNPDIVNQIYAKRFVPLMESKLPETAGKYPQMIDAAGWQAVEQIANYGGQGNQTPSDVQSFEYFSKGLTPDDRSQAMRYKLGLDQKPNADVKPLPNGGMMYEDSKTGKVFLMNPGDTSWREFTLPGRPQPTVERPDYTQEVDAGTNVPATAGYSPSEREAYEQVRANGGHWRANPTGAVNLSGGLPNLGRADDAKPETWDNPTPVMKNGKLVMMQRSNFGAERERPDLAPVPSSESTKPPAENELASKGYYDRVIASENELKKLGQEGFAPNVSDFYTAGQGPLLNWAASPKGQVWRQQQEDWVRAKLRNESGASIPTDEMDREIKTYFPQPGDSKDVIASKERSRAMAAQQLRTMAGKAIHNGQGGAPVKVNSKQQYDALPSGTRYIGPDGHEAVKK